MKKSLNLEEYRDGGGAKQVADTQETKVFTTRFEFSCKLIVYIEHFPNAKIF